ncbi:MULTISPECIES: hypothetical protein [Shewanella]|uniref:XRE family transcriptional regulator n=1 Tax=Shewanella marisflavi TaxID=260364 RepID=A0ABX5WNT3_9GAMM|nr:MULTISPECIES: hypothetical protein [Shewanella]QDF76227.1 hypothetical protein FGA12_14325 [Shewanella marisflavi]
MSKDALPEPSLSALVDEAFRQLESEYQASRPIVFSTGYISNLFLPPPNTVLKLFGIRNPTLFGMEVAEQELNLPLDIKSSSRHKLITSGVGLPSVKKVYQWTKELYHRVFTDSSIYTEITITRSAQVNSNALGWYSLVNNSEDMKRAHSSASFNEFKPLLSFLTQRCNDDVVCFEQIKSQFENRDVEAMTLADKLQLQSTFWLAHSDVESSTWEMLCHWLLQHEQQPIKDKESELSVFRCSVRLQLDFYLAAIAHFEVGNILSTTTDANLVLKPNGVLTKGILFYTQGEAQNCFDGLLHEIKRIYSMKQGSECTWRQLAAHIDIDDKAERAEKIKDEQYRQLKYWRNSQNMPSVNKLLQFFASLVGPNDIDCGAMLLSYAHITIALDKLLIEIKAPFNNYKHADDLTLVLQEELSRYADYYLRCMKQELPKVTANEA